ALHGGPVLAADDLTVASEEALLGLGRIARWGGAATVRLGGIGFGGRPGHDRLVLRSPALPPGRGGGRSALFGRAPGLRVGVGHLVGVDRRQRGSVALVELEVRRPRRLDDRRDRAFVALALDQQDRVGLVGDLLVREHTQPLVVQPALLLRAI